MLHLAIMDVTKVRVDFHREIATITIDEANSLDESQSKLNTSVCLPGSAANRGGADQQDGAYLLELRHARNNSMCFEG